MVDVRYVKGIGNYKVCSDIRNEVFIIEQGFKIDYDEIDDTCTHCILYEDNIAAGCARFYIDQENKAHLGRFAILKKYRKKGYGKVIVNSIKQEVKKMGYNEIYISAQVQAIEFYKSCGFEVISDIYLDEHCEHLDMVTKF